MYLLQLPPELIMEIFSYVGSGYFRWNMSRLSVCRQWYYFARLACFQDLYISQYILDRLARSPYLQENLCSIEESVEHLDLLLPSYEEERNRIARQRGHWCIASSSPDATGWASEQNANLARLAAAIKHSNRLRSLRICSLPVRPVKGVFDQLLNSADLFRNELLPFLTAGNLTCLDLDLWRDRDILRKTEREYGHGHHLCTMISKHLSTLRRLRVRMQPICPDVLKIKEENNKLRLSDVVINIIGTDRSPFEDGVVCCESMSYPYSGATTLERLKQQAKILVTQMAAPKMVRILTDHHSRNRVLALDILTGKRIAVREYGGWDEEGEVLGFFD